ncbi:MAG: hypothetical protein V5A13_08995, partial [Haloarculaceae archaeon]
MWTLSPTTERGRVNPRGRGPAEEGTERSDESGETRRKGTKDGEVRNVSGENVSGEAEGDESERRAKGEG